MEGLKEQKEKRMGCEANIFLLFRIINVADFQHLKSNACEEVSIVESTEH